MLLIVRVFVIKIKLIIAIFTFTQPDLAQNGLVLRSDCTQD